jgi:hypothetical protein
MSEVEQAKQHIYIVKMQQLLAEKNVLIDAQHKHAGW